MSLICEAQVTPALAWGCSKDYEETSIIHQEQGPEGPAKSSTSVLSPTYFPVYTPSSAWERKAVVSTAPSLFGGQGGVSSTVEGRRWQAWYYGKHL
jgi:hypothetical protein